MEWFETKSDYNPDFSSPRTDSYLLFNMSKYCGVKMREGNFEIKTYSGSVEAFKRIPIQLWEKWSKGVEHYEGFTRDTLNDGNTWIHVTKKRKLLFFDFQDNIVEVQEPNYDNYVVCQFEISEIKVMEDVWWSLNLEVSGKGNLSSHLKSAADYLLKDCPQELAKESAHSYPTWLQNYYQTKNLEWS